MSGRIGRDDGSATVVVLAVGLATTLLGGAVAAGGAAIVARHRAQAAADAAALAGAVRALDGEPAACGAAARVAASNGGRLVSCNLQGWDVVVTVGVRPAGPAAAIGSAIASARAGPL